MAFDFKKEYKEFYMPKNKPSIVEIPRMNYIAVRGTGISGCEKDLRNAYPQYNWKEGKRLTGEEDKSFIENWINS